MSIRFFATNRNFQRLGRDLGRDGRISLKKGGYYWIDAHNYMSHYFRDPDSSDLPPSAIIENSSDNLFDEFLAKPAVKRVVVGVHGFNVSLQEAITSFSMLADTLKRTKLLGPTIVTDPVYKVVRGEDGNQISRIITDWNDPGLTMEDKSDIRLMRKRNDLISAGSLDDPDGNITAFIGFSWPSNGKLIDYWSDRSEAISTAPVMANIIAHIREKNPDLKVHIIAHSMGNYILCQMLSGLVVQKLIPLLESDSPQILNQISRNDAGKASDYFVDRFIMLAPDVERREVTKSDFTADGKLYIGSFYEGLKHISEESHLFYSRFDSALQASVIEKEARETLHKAKELFTGQELKNRWENSLGLNPLPSLAPANMYDHNGVTLANRKIDHGDYFDSLEIGEVISEAVMSSR